VSNVSVLKQSVKVKRSSIACPLFWDPVSLPLMSATFRATPWCSSRLAIAAVIIVMHGPRESWHAPASAGAAMKPDRLARP
jgi:hypothetical protein